MRIAFEVIVLGHEAQNEDRQSRGVGNFSVLLPRILDRFAEFDRGSWTALLISSRSVLKRPGSIRRCRTQTDSFEKRAEKSSDVDFDGGSFSWSACV